MRFFDHSEFSSIGDGLWWALQTVTTVGYGDIVPENTIGRLVGAVVMLEGIAFLTIVTAVITSTFIERARRESLLSDESGAGQLLEKMRSIDERLQRIEQQLGEPSSRSSSTRPGASTRRSTSGAAACMAAQKRPGGSSRKAGRARMSRCHGAYVPQWIGTTTRARSSAAATAALSGFRWPGPSVGPQPQIGSSATSTGPRSAISGKTSVSPAK